MTYQLYNQAMELDISERANFIRSQCDDEKIIEEVFALLSIDNAHFTLLDQIAKESVQYEQQNMPKLGEYISVFQLVENLGSGGMGTVFKARRVDGSFEQTVAIKVVYPLLCTSSNQKLVNEASFMAKLNHPNICTVYDAGITETGLHYTVMEFLDGAEISTYFDNETVPLNNKLANFSTLCDAVNYAHQMQVIHGDLKPENIILTNEQQVKVLDFGISQLITNEDTNSEAPSHLQIRGMSKGFASPELMRGEKPSVYSDVYALGKILSNLLSQTAIRDKGSLDELNAIVDKGTASLPTNRYASVLELKQDITLFLSGHVVSAYQSTRIYSVKKFVFNRHLTAVLLSSLFTLITTALVINLAIQYHNLAQEKQQTDTMLAKFSLVLDLDFDKKSNVEMSLANNYASRGEDEKAEILYKKIIARFDKLHNTDIAFNAGSKLMHLLVQNKQYQLIAPNTAELKKRLVFIVGSDLPNTAVQALFYNSLINTSYYRSSLDISDTFVQHTQLLQAIKKTYWQEYTNSEKQYLNYLLSIKPESHNQDHSVSTFYYSPDNHDFIATLKYKFQSLLVENRYLVKANDILQFLESGAVFWHVTHENDVESEDENRVTFEAGTLRIRDNKGIYQVNGDVLSSDFGEGAESDDFLYLTPSLAVTVPGGGDMVLLTHKNLLDTDNSQQWQKEQLTGSTWYHIYDRALEKNAVISAALMEIKFDTTSAHLTLSGQSTRVEWDVVDGLLELYFADNDAHTLQFFKMSEGEELMVARNKSTGLFSLFTQNKQLAEYLVNRWVTGV